MRERRKAENFKKGYTTVELVVVTVIMLILAGTPVSYTHLAGMILGLLFGNQMIDWYLGILI